MERRRGKRREEKKQVGIYLPPDLYREVKRRVRRGDFRQLGARSVSDMVEIALRFLLRLDEELREAGLPKSAR